MKKIYYFAALFFMSITAVLCLVIVSFFTYYFKWQADTAQIGITLTYILAGLVGGFFLKWYPKWKEKGQDSIVQEQRLSYGFGQKMREAFLIGTLFMLILLGISILGLGNTFTFSKKVWIIWMLLAGSCCIGRMS